MNSLIIMLKIAVIFLLFPFSSLGCYDLLSFYTDISHHQIIPVSSKILRATDEINGFNNEPRSYIFDSVTQELTWMNQNNKKSPSNEYLDPVYELITFSLKEPNCIGKSPSRTEDLVCIIQTPNKIITISKLPSEGQRYFLIGIYNTFNSSNHPLLDISISTIHSIMTISREGLTDIPLKPLISFAILSRQRLSSHLQGVQFYGVGFNYESILSEPMEFTSVDLDSDICLTP